MIRSIEATAQIREEAYLRRCEVINSDDFFDPSMPPEGATLAEGIDLPTVEESWARRLEVNRRIVDGMIESMRDALGAMSAQATVLKAAKRWTELYNLIEDKENDPS